MITEAILKFFYNIIFGLINLLPVLSVPANLLAGVSSCVTLLNKFSYYIPVDTFIQCSLVMIALQNYQFLFWVGNWVIKRTTNIIP